MLAGCGGSESSSAKSAEPGASASPPAKSYTTTGQVRALPSEVPGSELVIFHEQIDDFIGADGRVQPMRGHAMPFPNIADTVQLDGLEPGDRVRFTFLVDWAADPVYIVTELEEVAPGGWGGEPGEDAGDEPG